MKTKKPAFECAMLDTGSVMKTKESLWIKRTKARSRVAEEPSLLLLNLLISLIVLLGTCVCSGHHDLTHGVCWTSMGEIALTIYGLVTHLRVKHGCDIRGVWWWLF